MRRLRVACQCDRVWYGAGMAAGPPEVPPLAPGRSPGQVMSSESQHVHPDEITYNGQLQPHGTLAVSRSWIAGPPGMGASRLPFKGGRVPYGQFHH